MCNKCVPDAHGSPWKRASDPLLLEVWMFVTCCVNTEN